MHGSTAETFMTMHHMPWTMGQSRVLTIIARLGGSTTGTNCVLSWSRGEDTGR